MTYRSKFYHLRRGIAKRRFWLKRHFTIYWVILPVLLLILTGLIILDLLVLNRFKPCINRFVLESNVSTGIYVPIVKSYKGLASYYSENGCVGCREDRLMANGKRFNENEMTLAFNNEPLGTKVKVINTLNNQSLIAEVTDTGGFNSLGRIADLSRGLKERIGCTDLCEVEIWVL